MNENTQNSGDFIGYDYKQVTVPHARASMYLDGYESFGWQQDENFGLPDEKSMVCLHLRRDRKIMNKMELTRLERNFEACMNELDKLEVSKATMPQIAALTVGIIGTAFMAGSTFAVTAATPIIWLCVFLAIPGFAGWIAPYFLYKKLVRKRTEIVNPLIEQKYDEIYELCRKGSGLI